MPTIIGVDESGKGDFFGPLVIAALLASDDDISKLKDMGVRDSKLIADNRILQIDAKLRAGFPHAILVISPEEYNRDYAKVKNLNIFLASGHASVIQSVLEHNTADYALSDQFGKPQLIERALAERGCNIRIEQVIRAESIPQVGAASILARAAFIKEMSLLADHVGMVLPKGASAQVDIAGRELVKRAGLGVLPSVAKMHFKNYQRVAGMPNLSKK